MGGYSKSLLNEKGIDMGTTPGSAARREVTVTIRDKNYTVKELTLGNYGEVENFIKSKYVRLYRGSALDLDPDEIHKRVMEILRTDVDSDELMDQFDATDTKVFIAYLAVRDNTEITLENYQELLDTDEVNIIAEAVNGLASDEENAPDEEGNTDEKADAENPPPPDQEIP